MPVYWIQPGAVPVVKIGWAEDVEGRRRDLQTAHYEVLRVIRVSDVPRGGEAALHTRFASQRVLGEWFRLSPDMLTVELTLAECQTHVHHPVIEAFGGLAAFTKAIGVDRMLASHWHRRGIPARYWPRVEEAAAERNIAVTAMQLMQMPERAAA